MIAAALLRYRLPAEILVGLLLVAGLLYGFHRFCETQRDIGRNEVKQQWDAQVAADAAAEAKLAAERQKNVDLATTQGAQRESTIKTLSAGSAAAVAGLRDATTAFQRSLSSLSAEAAAERATTASTLLGECAARYQDVATKADRHANDARTLSEAWQK